MGRELREGVLIASRYRLDRQLGEGGFAVVWAATHIVTRKRVALKFHVCATGEACTNGGCFVIPCVEGYTACGGACVDEYSDRDNCGKCGVACMPGELCLAGTCSTMPEGGACPMKCGYQCVYTQSDPNNCGGCGTLCSQSGGRGICTDSKCQILCAAGFADCDNDVANGCEVNIATDPNNCGRCAMACSLGALCMDGACTCCGGDAGLDAGGEPDATLLARDASGAKDSEADGSGCDGGCNLAHAISGCRDGSCAVLSCDAGYVDCDKAASNGCEVDTSTDTNHCGSCGNACAVGASCSAGICQCATSEVVCDAGPPSCVDTMTDSKNCGACGAPCASGISCVAGVCAPAMDAGVGDARTE